MQQNGLNHQQKPTVYWILQENHVTPFIIDFLKFFRSGAPNINLKFMIPSFWENVLNASKALDPQPFDVITNTDDSYEWYQKKRDAIEDIRFKDGLHAWRVLLADDLHSGQVHLFNPLLPEDPSVKFIMMQIPTPLGSFENEEKIFHSCIHWARSRKIPVIGYELLPFDTKWNLGQCLMDGIITTTERSYDWLTSDKAGIDTKTWLLPKYEAHFFSPASTFFWRNGLGLPYQNQFQHKIPDDKTVIYIPHNVAMSYEYKILIKKLSRWGDQLHLRISIGEDQIRGSFRHRQIVEMLSQEDLAKFHSYSFCDLAKIEEMVAADAVVACSSCHLAEVAALNSIPVLIVDPDIEKGRYGHTQIINNYNGLNKFITEIMASHKKTCALGSIFSQVLNPAMNRATS